MKTTLIMRLLLGAIPKKVCAHNTRFGKNRIRHISLNILFTMFFVYIYIITLYKYGNNHNIIKLV